MPQGGRVPLMTAYSGANSRSEGDIEQLTITGSPDAAEKQCNSTTQPLSYRGGHYALRQEVRSRPFSTSGTQNDQLPLRGDIVDDEDFNFEEPGSGSESDDEDYDEGVTEKPVQGSSRRDKKIPLKAESNEDEDIEEEDEEEEEEEDDEEMDEREEKHVKEKAPLDKTDDYENDKYENDDNNTKVDEPSERVHSDGEKDKSLNENAYDYNHPDEEFDKDDNVVEGSGMQSKIELAWSEWSPCSATCNWGRRTRTSYCLDNGLNLESCAEASSKRSETEACFVKLCPTTSTAAATITTTYIVTTPMPIFNTSVGLKKVECRVRCQNGGTCQPPYKCSCPRGVYGSLCQYVKQACKVNCRNGGTCYPPATCICQKGYFGTECQYGKCDSWSRTES
ncbi:EGF-like domain-containing protein [Trichonephila clavipes]|nr:EGF-like domain-containing protein [Trichonephila clavipes]